MQRREFVSYLGGTVTASAVWPSLLGAQQKAMPVIGYLSAGSPGPVAPYIAALRQGLSETGFVEGQNLTIEYRWAEGAYDQLPALAADLVSRKVGVIVTIGGISTVRVAKESTSTIPIVFGSGSDPIRDGLVASLARPGGNLTGVSTLVVDLMSKRLELLRELAPRAGLIALLANPTSANFEGVSRTVQEAARSIGMHVNVLKASSESEIDAAFLYLAQRQSSALLVEADPFFISRRGQIVALAKRDAVPAIYAWREYTTDGGLISYGPSLTGVFRQVGVYTGKILKGAKPADLPVWQPTTFELIINLKTAKTLGLTVPPSILARADEVIE